MDERPWLLLVDDEPLVLRTLSRQLSRAFRLLTAESADAALEVLAVSPGVAVVVSDLRMPDRNGLELLDDVRARYPDIGRVLLTASAYDIEMSGVLRSGSVHRLIAKPWRPEDFLSVIESLVFERALSSSPAR
jgi:two-component system, NtrC family, response regulator HupR/HoxA